MNYFKLIFVTFILFALSSEANDVQIIELHKNKSLDQLVLETENNENDEDNENDSINIENDNNIVEESNIIYKRYLCHNPYKSKEEDCFTSYLTL